MTMSAANINSGEMLRASNQNKLHTTLLSFTLLSQSLHSLISPSSRRLSRTTHFEVQVLPKCGRRAGATTRAQ